MKTKKPAAKNPAAKKSAAKKRPAKKRPAKRAARTGRVTVMQKGTGMLAEIPREELTLTKKAERLADEFEAEAKRLQSIADILRGKV